MIPTSQIIPNFFNTHGKFLAVIRLLFYPITVVFTTPLRLFQSLPILSKLFNGDWGNYSTLSEFLATNHCFYFTIAHNLNKYGRAGKAKHLGEGNFRLGGFFHYSLISLYAFWKMPVPVMLSLFLAPFTFLCFMNPVLGYNLFIVVAALFFSVSIYNSVLTMNYNALGWIFFPLFLFSLLNNSILLLSASMILIILGSFTVGFISGILWFVILVSNFSIELLLAPIPMLIIISFRLVGLFADKESLKDAKVILEWIGLGGKKTKLRYKRTSSNKLTIEKIYYLLLCFQFILAEYIFTNNLNILFLTITGLYFLNATYLRFADRQSSLLACVFVATASILNNYNPYLLISYLLLINPLPGTILLDNPNKIDMVPKMFLFDIGPIYEGLKNFLSPIPKNNRFYVAYDNPNDVYEDLFLNYPKVQLNEAVSYIATQEEIHYFSDFWTIFTTNYEGAPDLWGRDKVSIQKNSNDWNIDYVAILQNENEEFDSKSIDYMDYIHSFDWRDYSQIFGDAGIYKNEMLIYHLYKVRK